MENPQPRGIDCVRLKNSFEAFGMVVDFLSRHPPFGHYDAEQLSAAVRLQLLRQTHVAALKGNVLVGYFGWLRTRKDIAEAWSEDRGPLRSVPLEMSDAAAVTIVVAPDSQLLRQLVRHARALHPETTVFFKRQSAGKTRKAMVRSMVFGAE